MKLNEMWLFAERIFYIFAIVFLIIIPAFLGCLKLFHMVWG